MSAVQLEFDPGEERLTAIFSDPSVLRHPLVAGYIRQAGGVVTNETVRIPTPLAALGSRYQSLNKVLARLGMEAELGTNVAGALGAVERDELAFQSFSRQAENIWHRKFDVAHFEEFVREVEKETPGRTFYSKQLLSAYHLAFSQNACNFSVPGAGKTSIVYGAFAYLRSAASADQKRVDRLLIVGPLSSFKAWEDEYASIFGRRPRSKRISGIMPAGDRSAFLRGANYADRDVELVLTSYATLASSEEDFRVYLSHPVHRTMVVLDEAHYIKRDDGQWAAAALRLAPLARARVILTGTPAPNGYEDLGNLFRFIYPTRNVVGFPPATLRAMSNGNMPAAVEDLKDRIRPYYTRIRKSDLNLPHVEEFRVGVAMGEAQSAIYRAIERQVVPQLRQYLQSASPTAARVRARLIRLRQACANPELLLKPIEDFGLFDSDGDLSLAELEIADRVRAFDTKQDLSRLAVAVDLVDRILQEQGKVLIWSYFIGNLLRLRETFEKKAGFVEVLTGATPVSGGDVEDELGLPTRESIIDGFHEANGPAILIANPQAVGESISLHKACRTAIYFDRDFNAGRFIQSKDRIHRYSPEIGRDVTYYYLVAAATVDEDIDARLRQKEARLTDLVDSEEIPLLTADSDEDALDVRAVLEAYERRKTI